MSDKQLLEHIRRLSLVFLRPDNKAPDLTDGAKAIAEVTSSAVLVINNAGDILANYLNEVKTGERLKLMGESGSLACDSDLLMLIKGSATLFNEPYPASATSMCIMVPIVGGGGRLASLFLNRPEGSFENLHLILAEVGAALMGMIILQAESVQVDKDNRNRALAEGAFESLSYSEVEAIREILKNINNKESVVVASKIADGLGITRSVIVNALRKFESAGIIESRSLGMKGTFIRVKNKHALDLVASRSAKVSHFR